MIRVSPTTGLNLFQECPRCFWLRYNRGIFRPKGISSSLPVGLDLMIKKYFDSYRRLGKLPPELEGRIKGKLMTDLDILEEWRNWQSHKLEYEHKDLGITLFGALDDCLVEGEYYLPLDYKTRGYPPKAGQAEEFYQTQLDSYSLLLSKNGYKTKNLAYLIYFFPKKIEVDSLRNGGKENKNTRIEFETEIVEVKTNEERVEKILGEIIPLLRGPIPEKNQDCEYCNYLDLRKEEDRKPSLWNN